MQIAFQLTELFQIEIDAVIYTEQLLVTLEHGPSKGWSGVHLLHDIVFSYKCEVVKSFFASEKVIHLIHLTWVLFPRLKKMLSGNKYTSRSSLSSTVYQCLQQIPRLFICYSRQGKKVTKMCFSKGGILWMFVIKICLIKRSTDVIRTQWQNFLQDPRTHSGSWKILCFWHLSESCFLLGTQKK